MLITSLISTTYSIDIMDSQQQETSESAYIVITSSTLSWYYFQYCTHNRCIYVCICSLWGQRSDKNMSLNCIYVLQYIFIQSSTADHTVSTIYYTTWLTFVLCSLKIMPARFHMGIFDRHPDSSNIGPTLLHFSHIDKMIKDTRPKG